MKLILSRLLSYFPSALPTGVQEFANWADEVIQLAGLPASQESQSQALCNMIMHLPPRKSDQRPTAYKSKNWFVHALRKGASNQIASFVFQEIRLDMEKKAKEAVEQAAATAGTESGDGKTA